jgi:hypothetical protein
MNRRHFLKTSLAAAAASGVGGRLLGASRSAGRTPRILLRNSWQSVNIGDIGHTPGALRLFEEHFPEAELILWPGRLEHGSREMLMNGFPKLRIVEGSVGADGKPTTPELAKAWAETDVYVSGSGSGFPAHQHAVAFRKATGKPVGVFGVSTDPISGFGGSRDPEGGTLADLRKRALALPSDHLAADLRFILNEASFMFCRDTISLEYLRNQKVKAPILEFGPDSQLGMHLRDDAKGYAYLRANGLEEGKFICVIPRVRYTPYHHMRGNTTLTDVERHKDAINTRTNEQDLSKMREMMIAYVRATGGKVMTCPEMTYQVGTAKEYLIDPLPADVRKNVVWRNTYWLPDEAASIYTKALAVISADCHSPLIAYRVGTPAIYLRQPTDTCKGQMYRDFGAERWMLEVDETDGPLLWSRVQEIYNDPVAAKAQVEKIMTGVRRLQQRMVGAVRTAAGVS